MDQFLWQSNNGRIPLLLEVQRQFLPASGLSPTVEVKRASDEYFADWTTQTFKAPAASGDREALMTEVNNSPGVYKKLFNPVDFQQTQTHQSYIVTYRSTFPSGYSIGNETFTEDTEVTVTDMHFFTDIVASGSNSLKMTAEFVG